MDVLLLHAAFPWTRLTAPIRWMPALLVMTAGLSLAPAARAVERVRTDVHRLGPEEVQQDELWVLADTIELAGTVSNDVSAAGANVALSGRFEQSVAALAGSNLTFNGHAREILRLAGRYIQLDGTAEDSVVATGLTISVSPSNRLAATTVLIGDTVVTDGAAEGDVWVMANSATIQGRIEGTLHATAQDIVVVPGTEIRGDFLYSAPRDIVLSNRVRVDGRVERRAPARFGLTYADFLVIHAILLGGAILAGIPFIRLFPRTVVHTTGHLAKAPARCVLTGLGLGVVLPLAALLLLVIPVTLPLAIVLLMTLVLLAYFAQIAVALTLGGLVLRRRRMDPPPQALPALAAGLVILYFATAIPIVNGVLWILILLAGMGSLALGTWTSQRLLPAPIYPDPPGGSGDSGNARYPPPPMNDPS